ncbi:DUF3307 domain-containing protein [Glycocaulis profundi]|nr:DUF3307 domain-containing protein [Glycocaulis profundi]
MAETFIALLFAHVLADFVFQFSWIIRRKRDPGMFVLHVLIVTVLAALALGGGPWQALLVIAVTHAFFDALKLWAQPEWMKRDQAFVTDQAAHLAVLAAVAALWPGSFAGGVWASPPDWLDLRIPVTAEAGLAMAVCIAGFVMATRAGGFFMAMFMERFPLIPAPAPEQKRAAGAPEAVAAERLDAGLPQGGTWIGLTERALVFVFILVGEFAAIGFLLAAKSVLRFQYAKERSQSEYVIIGTLLSLSWAVGAGLSAKALMAAL